MDFERVWEMDLGGEAYDELIYPEYGHEAINLGLEDKMYKLAMKI